MRHPVSSCKARAEVEGAVRASLANLARLDSFKLDIVTLKPGVARP